MRRPFQYTFTPSDRRVYQQWLVGVSIFYGCIALMILAVVLSRAYVGNAGDAVALALQSHDAHSKKMSEPVVMHVDAVGDSNIFKHAY